MKGWRKGREEGERKRGVGKREGRRRRGYREGKGRLGVDPAKFERKLTPLIRGRYY